MRKITAGLFIALDGVVEAPDQWHFPYFNEEMGAAVDATLGAADTVLFGRKTYDSFAGALNVPASTKTAQARSTHRVLRRFRRSPSAP
jgi:dihydrofolate reductase